MQLCPKAKYHKTTYDNIVLDVHYHECDYNNQCHIWLHCCSFPNPNDFIVPWEGGRKCVNNYFTYIIIVIRCG